MEALTFILLIVIVVMLISIRNNQSDRLKSLEAKINHLFEEITKRSSSKDPVGESRKPEFKEPTVIEHKLPEPKLEPPAKIEEIKQVIPEEKPAPIEIPDNPEVIEPPLAARIPKPVRPGFFERNPDLEKFIGENLANKIGIGVLVLGIGFFVKYAIDQDWINEIGRVFIGILCGGLLLGIAHRLRSRFHAFSSVLVGGGIAVLYLTIAIAFHEYHIFSQTVAFSLMLGITVFSVVFALGYDRIELAILSILGGFASPFMVSTGEGNYIVLFTYIIILDSGMLVLSYYKKWNPVNIVCYVFTLLLFGSWLSSGFNPEDISMIRGALLFATVFYLVFFAMNIINNIKERTSFKAFEIGLLLSNTFFYYAAGMYILNNLYGDDFRGLFTASMGIFNFIFAYSLFKSTRVDKNLVFLLIGLVLTFISLAAPIQLKGNHITLFWSAETVLLLWLSQKSGIRLMKLASVLVMGLMVISLIMDWRQIYYYSVNPEDILSIALNRGYVTGIFSVASIFITHFLLKNEQTEKSESIKIYRGLLLFAGILLLYISQLLELTYQLDLFVDDAFARRVIIGTYNMIYILAVLLIEKKLKVANELKPLIPALGIVAIGSYLLYYESLIAHVRNRYLEGMASNTGFAFHYLFVIFLMLAAIVSYRKMNAIPDFSEKSYNIFSWFFVFFLVFILSAELDNVVLILGYSETNSITSLLSHNRKIGYPILWGLTSFVLIAVGLQRKKKHLRIISLTLFLITLLKLFLIDIRGISEGGKIAAFISLGILLLIVSFMYQRLKRILLADESEKS